MCGDNKSCITINCGCCGNNGGTDIGSGTPVGTILAYMGTTAPRHYLICDGIELDIADYPELSKQIRNEFGIVNYFGGDGISTFSLPDLRNQFLRGYHGEAPDLLSDEIGQHQEATGIPYIYGNINPIGIVVDYSGKGDKLDLPDNMDMRHINENRTFAINSNYTLFPSEGYASPYKYTTRPANVAVLYCIKYE